VNVLTDAIREHIMNDREYTDAELKEIEAANAAREATWLPLQHVAQTHKPAWKAGEEIIKVQDKDSIHGNPRPMTGEGEE
jgi:predicted metal-dependent phosphotriesterase family hydrolase